MRVRILFSQSGSPTSGSEDISLVILIVIISVGVIVSLGIVLILVMGLVYYKKRVRINKPSCSNTCSPTGKPQGSHLIGNDLYNSAQVAGLSLPHQTSSLRSQTDNDATEPAVEPEYLSITNLGRNQRQTSHNTNSLSPEGMPEYLSITNIGQQNSALSSTLQPRARSAGVIPDNEPEYASLTSSHLQNMHQQVPMVANPSYVVVKSGGMKMTQNSAYMTNRDAIPSHERR